MVSGLEMLIFITHTGAVHIKDHNNLKEKGQYHPVWTLSGPWDLPINITNKEEDKEYCCVRPLSTFNLLGLKLKMQTQISL